MSVAPRPVISTDPGQSSPGKLNAASGMTKRGRPMSQYPQSASLIIIDRVVSHSQANFFLELFSAERRRISLPPYLSVPSDHRTFYNLWLLSSHGVTWPPLATCRSVFLSSLSPGLTDNSSLCFPTKKHLQLWEIRDLWKWSICAGLLPKLQNEITPKDCNSKQTNC